MHFCYRYCEAARWRVFPLPDILERDNVRMPVPESATEIAPIRVHSGERTLAIFNAVTFDRHVDREWKRAPLVPTKRRGTTGYNQYPLRNRPAQFLLRYAEREQRFHQ